MLPLTKRAEKKVAFSASRFDQVPSNRQNQNSTTETDTDDLFDPKPSVKRKRKSVNNQVIGSHSRPGISQSPRKRRVPTVYDAVAGRIGAHGFISSTPSYSKNRDRPIVSNKPLPADEILFNRKHARIRFEEEADYAAGIEDHPLPSGEMLAVLHRYVSNFYDQHHIENKSLHYKSLDGTALLALGVLLEETVKDSLGKTGHLTFLERGDRDDSAPPLWWNGERWVTSVIEQSEEEEEEDVVSGANAENPNTLAQHTASGQTNLLREGDESEDYSSSSDISSGDEKEDPALIRKMALQGEPTSVPTGSDVDMDDMDGSDSSESGIREHNLSKESSVSELKSHSSSSSEMESESRSSGPSDHSTQNDEESDSGEDDISLSDDVAVTHSQTKSSVPQSSISSSASSSEDLESSEEEWDTKPVTAAPDSKSRVTGSPNQEMTALRSTSTPEQPMQELRGSKSPPTHKSITIHSSSFKASVSVEDAEQVSSSAKQIKLKHPDRSEIFERKGSKTRKLPAVKPKDERSSKISIDESKLEKSRTRDTFYEDMDKILKTLMSK